MGVILLLGGIAYALFVLFPRIKERRKRKKTPKEKIVLACGAIYEDYYRCHLPVGHEGPHLCDDLGGVFTWTD